MVKIFIGNVAQGTDEGQIRELFEEYGPVSECALVGSYAFIHIDDHTLADKAIQATNGKTLNGQQLSVELSHGKKRGGGGGGGGPMRGRGGPSNGRGRGRGGPPRGSMGRGGSRSEFPGFRPRPWEMESFSDAGRPYGSRGPGSRGNLRGGPGRGMPARGMGAPPNRGGRFSRPPRGPRGSARGGRGGYGLEDGGGMMYPAGSFVYEDGDYYADPNALMVDGAVGGEYDYYGGGEYAVQDPSGSGVYDAYSTADYTGAEGYDQSAYYGEYVYDYPQDPNYAAPAANGARYNPYSTQ